MLWLVMTTGKCNLKCDYCGGSFPSNVVPYDVKYDINMLKRLIENDKDSTVIFYGGEPLLNYKFIMAVLDNVRAKRYGIQTNGIASRLLPEKYWKKINVVLLSIDGREEITDKHRGKGIYKAVLRTAKYLKDLGVETIARMTVTQDTDIFADVMHLINLGLFDKVHWQLDVIWSEEWDFKSWSFSYLNGIKRLTDYFLSELRKGRVVKIIPILGVISAHFFGGYKGSPCGAGYSSVTVTPDGRILSCPIAVREKWAELGNVSLGYKLLEDPLPDDCKRCEFKQYCGGRCLYAQKERYWGEEGFKAVDEVNKEYLRTVLSIIPEIERIIRDGKIRLSDLYYNPILDSTEIIP
ncbi:TIGR04084 family radical SAM/SPASM domain-containing protein [Sulfolobus sp. E5-1-F]|uniref:radical SAM/SPASM domain-containing protein n=1 Tax=Sulfolobaceae TaxID=118883 RepID=UPI001296DB89|nr:MULTISPECIES: radical SAM/SPASM domain-containing protein [unclassified Sulfolobus]QGA53381.1 TIGR04084 family radical SAM/SPASM domain-containing protein [Sulfolobus sp. E5-1-F]QGA68486.1 TIGR04084 family radical SAM/SPASM domain-containing protein [Sulfolobus sp. E11-6]